MSTKEPNWEDMIRRANENPDLTFSPIAIAKDEEFKKLEEELREAKELLQRAYEEIKAREGYVLMPDEWSKSMEASWTARGRTFVTSWNDLVREFSYKEKE